MFNINSRLFSHLYNSKKELAIFILLSTKYPHKRFNSDIKVIANDCGVGITTLKSSIAALKRLNLIKLDHKTLVLKSNRLIDEQYGSTKKIFLLDTTSYKSIKNNIETLILTSAKYRQEKAISIKENISRINRKLNEGIFVTKKELSYVKRNKKYSSEIVEPNLSNRRICELIGRKTYQTANRRKMLAKEIGLLFYRRYKKIIECSIEMFRNLKRIGELNYHAKWYNGVVFEDMANGFTYTEVNRYRGFKELFD